jgi:hypothetical protein
MTSEDQLGQPTQHDHDPVEETQRLADLSSGSRSKRRSLRNQRKSRWIGIGLSLALIAGVAAAIISITTTGTNQTASSGSAGPGATVGTPGSTSGGVISNGSNRAKGEVISPAKLAQEGGALNLPKNRRSQVISWHSGPGGTQLTAVSNGFGTALQAAGARQYSPMRHACAQLAASVATAKAGPPIPIATMQEVYAKALAKLAKGAADCNSAISLKPGDETVEIHLDSSLLHQSVSELSVGATDVFRSTAQIEIISRQHN